MVDYTKLNDKIENSGIKRNVIANQLGITSKTLSNKLNDKSEFTISQITQISKVLHLSFFELKDIFFSKWVE